MACLPSGSKELAATGTHKNIGASVHINASFTYYIHNHVAMKIYTKV